MDYWPVLGPLLGLLKSRKFLTALVTLIVDIIIVYTPSLESVRVELIVVLTALASVLIGGIAYEDAAKHAAPKG